MNPYCQTNLKLAVGFPLCSCVHQSTRHESAQHGKIFLYEELPSNERILEKELKIWMQNQEDDDTVGLIFGGQDDGANCSPATRNFYRHIKQEYPKIVFHGTNMSVLTRCAYRKRFPC